MENNTKIAILACLIFIPILILISLHIFKNFNLYFTIALIVLDILLCLRWLILVRFFKYKK